MKLEQSKTPAHTKMESLQNKNIYRYSTSCFDQGGKQLFECDISPDALKVDLLATGGLTASVRGQSSKSSDFVTHEISVLPILDCLSIEILNYEAPEAQKEQLLEQSEYKRYRSHVIRSDESVDDEEIFKELVTREPLDSSSPKVAQILTDAYQLNNDVKNLTDALKSITTLQSVLQEKLNKLREKQTALQNKHYKVIQSATPSVEERYAKFFKTVLSYEMDEPKLDNLLDKIIELMKDQGKR